MLSLLLLVAFAIPFIALSVECKAPRQVVIQRAESKFKEFNQNPGIDYEQLLAQMEHQHVRAMLLNNYVHK